MNPNTTALQQVQQQRGEVEFIPFGADTKIKLSVKIIKDYVAIPTKSGKLPDDRDCMKFMMLCRARKLNPFEGDCFLQGYDGRDGAQFSLITAHQAFLKRAEVNPEFDGMNSGVIVKDENDAIIDRSGDFLFPGDVLLGAWATVFFKQRKHPTTRRLNLTTFNQGFGRWQKDAAGMIVKCAEADALRSSFPTMLGGLYSEGEMPIIEVGAAAKSPAFMIPQIAEPAKPPADSPGTGDREPEPSSPPEAAKTPQTTSGEAGEVKSEAGEPVADGFKADPHHSPDLSNFRYLAFKSGVPEEKIVSYCKANSVMKPEQSRLAELSTAKIKQLSANWTTIAPLILKGE